VFQVLEDMVASNKLRWFVNTLEDRSFRAFITSDSVQRNHGQGELESLKQICTGLGQQPKYLRKFFYKVLRRLLEYQRIITCLPPNLVRRPFLCE
jgi:hypothetical protein